VTAAAAVGKIGRISELFKEVILVLKNINKKRDTKSTYNFK
jgi:hypothetical protein